MVGLNCGCDHVSAFGGPQGLAGNLRLANVTSTTQTPILTFPPTAAENLKAVQCVRNGKRTAADGETAGRNINDVTGVTNCDGTPTKFR